MKSCLRRGLRTGEHLFHLCNTAVCSAESTVLPGVCHINKFDHHLLHPWDSQELTDQPQQKKDPKFLALSEKMDMKLRQGKPNPPAHVPHS